MAGSNVMTGISIRKATSSDARHIAELVAMSSDGVAVIEWEEDARQRGNGVTPLDIGTEVYSKADGDYSFANCLVAESEGNIAGMLLAFAMPEDCIPTSDKTRPGEDDNNVFAPYMYLEEPDSWYVCGVAVYPEYQGRGIGRQFMMIAEQQAQQRNLHKVSLVVFENNTRALELYRRLGYKVIDHAPVVPHPRIPYTGNALLMVKSCQ